MSLVRAASLEAVFRAIATERMAGLPFLHPGLRVQAVGFAPVPDEPGVLLGVLVTPWFMNLVRLPQSALEPLAGIAAGWLQVGHTAPRAVGSHRMDFIGGCETGLGVFEAASLFSPMGDFADHEAALAAAQEVLRQLLAPPDAPAPEPAPAPAAAPVPSRRGFLFGRSAAGSGA